MSFPCVSVRVSAPGKVILHGEHAVMFGKTALASSLGLRTTLTLKEVKSECPALEIHFPSVALDGVIICMESIVEHLLKKICVEWAAPESVDHGKLLEAVDSFIAKFVESSHAWNGFQRNAMRGLLYLMTGVLGGVALCHTVRASVQSAVAVGAGSGSSAAFAVCAAAALLQLRRARDFADVRGADVRDADERALISAWAYNCERIMHGAPSGIDNATCTYGGLVWFRKGSAPRPLRPALNLRVLLVDSRVSRQTKALAERVAALRARNPLAVQSVLDAVGHVADTAVQLLERPPAGDEDAATRYRLLAELWDINHCLLAALSVSHPVLEDIRQRAARHQLSSKLTGAGGGGYAVVLIPPSAEECTVRALSEELRSAGYGVTDTLLGGEGVALDPE